MELSIDLANSYNLLILYIVISYISVLFLIRIGCIEYKKVFGKAGDNDFHVMSGFLFVISPIAFAGWLLVGIPMGFRLVFIYLSKLITWKT